MNTGLNFNSISLKNHKGTIIIWIVKFFLEIGSITGCCSCCWIRPFCGDEYGLIDHWSGIFSYKNMSITVQLQFDSWSKNSWIKNKILFMQGCRCFCCHSNPADFEAFFFLSFFLHWRICWHQTTTDLKSFGAFCLFACREHRILLLSAPEHSRPDICVQNSLWTQDCWLSLRIWVCVPIELYCIVLYF